MNSRPRTLIIINQTAARARAARARIESTLKAKAVSFDLHETRHAGDATGVTRAALREGYRLVAVVGGDGTLSETAAGFFALDERKLRPKQQATNAERQPEKEANGEAPAVVSPGAALAVLPAGTGDDFARGLVGRREPVERWLERLIDYYERPCESAARDIDVIFGSTKTDAQEFICINVATLGIGAEVARRVAAQNALVRRLPGEARFTAAACGALLAWRERHVRVGVDDHPIFECRSNLLAVANGIYAGGGMMFAPDARPDDRLMNLLLACELKRTTILRELPRIRRGAHLDNPKVRELLCRKVSIEPVGSNDALLIEADGNVRGHTPVEFRIMPAALRIVTGNQLTTR